VEPKVRFSEMGGNKRLRSLDSAENLCIMQAANALPNAWSLLGFIVHQLMH